MNVPGFLGNDWLNSLESHVAHCVFILLEYVVDTDTSLVFVFIDGGLKSRYLLLEAIQGMSAFEKLGDEILVDNMTLKLCGGHFLAVSELEVLSKKGSAIKLLATAYAGKLLVDSMVLIYVSDYTFYISY
jgi:hypothetical protein